MDKSILFHVSDQELIPTQSTYSHISDIDNYDNDSIKEIIYQDLCDYFQEDDVKQLLDKAYEKLAHGGVIHIQGSDLRQVGIAIAFNMVTEDIIKRVLYPNKKSIHTLSEILGYLKNIGFVIDIKKYINVFEYYIRATKQ